MLTLSYGYGTNEDSGFFQADLAAFAVNTSLAFHDPVLRWWWIFEPSGMEMLINEYIIKSIISNEMSFEDKKVL